MVDVTVSTRISGPPEAVAAVMLDAARDPEWIGGARRVDVLGPLPYAIGTRVRRHGAFFGRRFSWTTEIVDLTPGRLARMRHVAGPFKGGVDYSIAPAEGGSEVTIRNYGEASFWVPFTAVIMRASIGGDLRRLKRLVEVGRR